MGVCALGVYSVAQPILSQCNHLPVLKKDYREPFTSAKLFKGNKTKGNIAERKKRKWNNKTNENIESKNYTLRVYTLGVYTLGVYSLGQPILSPCIHLPVLKKDYRGPFTSAKLFRE